MQIVVTAERLKGYACQEFFKPLGLSSITFKILHVLSAHSAMTPTQILQALDCSKSNLTQRINLLERDGLVSRMPSQTEGDGRTVQIALTEAGKRKVAEAIQALRKNGALLETHFSDSEKKACHAFMKKVNQLLEPYEHTRACSHR
ncbi:MarR family transcriptional regulator [Candidatus Peregrinibacteria bacterium]|nr:MarR family transcriptional regulator [Candidatus Peregrinibacteria bacterium]